MLEPLLRYFRQQLRASKDVAQLCYLSAYDAFPNFCLRDPEQFFKIYKHNHSPGLQWYLLMCRLTESSPDPFVAAAFHWHEGQTEDGRDYLILEYPDPEPIALTAIELQEGELPDKEQVLAPYFSIFLRGTASQQASCFALGQSPVAEETTLRRCTTAAHYNLGRGPEAFLEDLVEILEGLESREIKAATVRHQDYLSKFDKLLLASIPEEGE